jgi:hypothetical protein
MADCDDCRQTSSAGGCWRHSQGVVATMTSLYHAHRWVFDAVLADGSMLYHCDEHDPPETRMIRPPLGLKVL